jgi:hypothetical protein
MPRKSHPREMCLYARIETYQAANDKDFMAGFPLEGTPEARLQEQAWRAMFS